ncbi:MAG TPA: hypothetical protein VKS22_17430 [Candidatus Binataceae bacterium]|nr:hypothetical protein [Candidatus Binataceae bacterium]
MIWLRRSIVLAPVLAFLAAALLLSCGGGSTTTTTSQGLPFALFSLAICPGIGPTITPTPVPTNTKRPKKTPTPMCSPVPTVFVSPTAVPVNGFQFNLQGAVSQNSLGKGKKLFHDFTNDTQVVWGFPPGVELQPDGLFIGLQQGCYCVNASIGSVSSLTIGLWVQCPQSDPTCASSTPVDCSTATPCPQLPTSTPTPK